MKILIALLCCLAVVGCKKVEQARQSFASLAVESDSATLICIAPTQNTDGSPLTNLASFAYFYGTSPTTLNKTVTTIGKTCGTVITGLAPGTWYFAARAITSAGASSDLSNIDSKSISGGTPTPVNCVISTFGPWTDISGWSVCTNGAQSKTQQATATVVTPASNGGAACPPLTKTQTIFQSCTVGTQTLKTIGGDVFEAIADYNATITASVPSKFSWRNGSKVGTIKTGIACMPTYQVAASSYYRIAVTSVSWTGSKKTYVVANCKLQ